MDVEKTITANKIRELITGFETGTLPREKWTHEAHLLTGLWYLCGFPKNEAIEKIRYGIINYNLAGGVENTETSGYHETITLFWILIVEKFLEKNKNNQPVHILANHILEEKYESSLPLEFYSRELLFSPKARKEWIEPDLKLI